MKKIIAVVIVIALALSMAGCGSKASGPEGTVQGFCDAMKALDLSKMKEYVGGTLLPDDIDLSHVPDAFVDLLKMWTKELHYKVGKAETSGSKSKVSVDFTYTDAAPVIKAALSDYLSKAISMALSGETSEEALTKLFLECIDEAGKTTKPGTKDATLTFALEQVDGKWLITEAPADLTDVLFSNILESIEGLLE